MNQDTVIINRDDTLKTFTVRRQKAINKLTPLYDQGIPVVYPYVTRSNLLIRFNLLLYRALHGYYNNIDCQDMKEYEQEALRACQSLHGLASGVEQGARIDYNTKPLKSLRSMGKLSNLP